MSLKDTFLDHGQHIRLPLSLGAVGHASEMSRRMVGGA